MRRPETVRDILLAALAGLAVALTVAVGGILMLQAGSRESLPTLNQATQTGVETVGRTVSDQLGRALGYGIPLDSLYGLDTFFGNIIDGSPNVAALALRDPAGAVVYETRPDVQGTDFAVTVDGNERAVLVLAAAPPLLGPAIDRLRIALAANAAVFGLIGAVLVFLLLTRHYAVARDRLEGAMRAAMDDRYPALPPHSGGGSVAAAYAAYDRCLEALRAAARTLDDAVATVRAIDFDGSLAKRVTPLIAPVSGPLALTGTEDSEPAWQERRTGAVWLAVIAAGTYAMTLPFVANFAIDRQWAYASQVWWPVYPVIVECIAAMLAFALVRPLNDIGRPFAAALGLIATGFATAAVYWTRDYTTFLELRGLAAAGFGAAAAALAGRRSAAERAPFLAVLLVAVLVAGPLVGALLGEAVGRRTGFLVIGALILALAPLALIVRRSQGAASGTAVAPPWRVLPVAAMGTAVGATLLVWLPAGPGYENYLLCGLMVAAAGLAAGLIASLASATGPVRSRLLAAVLTAAGMIALSFSDGSLAIGLSGVIVFGAGIGGLAATTHTRLDEAVAPLGVGVAAGAGSVGLAGLTALPPLVPGAVLAMALALAGILVSARTTRTAG